MKTLTIFLGLCLFSTASKPCHPYDKSESHFFCPLNYTKVGGFEIQVTPVQDLIIQCQDLNSLQMPQFPNIAPSNITHLQLHSCPLPKTGFKKIQDRFSKENLNSIEYEYGNPPNQELTKQMFHDLKHLRSVKLAHNKLGSLDESAFATTPNLVGLVLKRNNLSAIKAKLFKNLKVLDWLDLSGNRLENLPPGVFKSLKKVTNLDLSGNQITTLANSTFEGLSSLQVLDLSANKIETISVKTFRQLKTLAHLSLAMNNLKSLPVGLFSKNSKLDLLILKDNPNFKIKGSLFSKFSALKTLDLSNCNLTELPEEIFENLHDLQTLFLKKNALKTLPEQIFEDLFNLEKLDLSDNELDDVDAMPSSLKNLEILNLENNAIRIINEGAFSNLILLEELNLAQNQIKHIQQLAFVNNYRLRAIDLSRNGYNGQGNIFKNLMFLQNLNLSYNLITNIEGLITLRHKPLMEVLDLRKNLISNLSLLNLQDWSNVDVNLESNNISVVNFDHVDLIEYYNTVTIHLANNPLKCDCTNYDLMKYLKGGSNREVTMKFDIRIGSVNCEALDNSIDSLELSTITCPLEDSGCPEECLCSWRPFDSSLVVDCSNRNLTYLPNITTSSFQRTNFTQIEVHLESNRLTSANLSLYKNITSLFLSNNNLVTVQGEPDRNLKVLELDHNQLSTLGREFVQKFNKWSMSNLLLNNNPWTCDCDSENLRLFVRKHLDVVDFTRVFCYNGTARFADFTEGQLCKHWKQIYASPVVVFFLALTVSCIFSLVFIFYVKIDGVPLVHYFERGLLWFCLLCAKIKMYFWNCF
ncbi:hypothetical protein Zmor_002575 [Zophobas morio]|uniref:Uncharacterized protein n=1 Tax=Zophobas morio TaxID=2755281 RepID=A0AA38MQ85_9CUCU|nr:hypothetical protein Zmor_002575 [Zophobas morio]